MFVKAVRSAVRVELCGGGYFLSFRAWAVVS